MLSKPALVLSVILIIFVIQNLSAQYNIPYNVISSGGEISSTQEYVLNGTAGETITGPAGNSEHSQYAGFWHLYLFNIITPADDHNVLKPVVFKLEQNYPNPFNPATTIKFEIPERSSVLIKIYDILGSEVKTLINKEMEAGWYSELFDASRYSSGIYICRMQAGNYMSTKKMIVLK
jgi:hypothetical protein